MARRISRRRNRRSSRRTFVVVAALLVAAGVAYALGPQIAQATQGLLAPDPVAMPAEPTAPPTVVAGVIVDASGSNGGRESARATLSLLADVVKAWPGLEPTREGGSPGAAGLDLTVRQVSDASFGSGAQIARIILPPVPPVPQRPSDMTDVATNQAFLDAADAAASAWQRATGLAREASSALASAQLNGRASEIAGAIASLAQVLPASDLPRRVVIVSDLEQAGADPQVATGVAGDLSNAVVTAFQRCDRGAARCDKAQQAFARLVSRLNGDRPSFRRIESLQTGLAEALAP